MNTILEKIKRLATAIKMSDELVEDKESDIQSLESYICAWPSYLNSVINFVIKGNLVRILYDGEEFRDRMTKLDSDRRSCHIMATDAVNKLNRLAKIYGQPSIINIGRDLDSKSTEDRNIAVNLTYRFCVETFLDEMERSGYTIDSSLDEILQDMAEKHHTFNTELHLETEQDQER